MPRNCLKSNCFTYDGSLNSCAKYDGSAFEVHKNQKMGKVDYRNHQMCDVYLGFSRSCLHFILLKFRS